MKTKQILFIVPPGTVWPNVEDLHDLIPQGYMPNVAKSLDEAKAFVDMGVSVVIMSPFSLPLDKYVLQDKKIDPTYGGGYCFWQQELQIDHVPTIVVDLNILTKNLFLELQKEWNSKVVKFFDYPDHSSWKGLVALIKDFGQKLLKHAEV